MDSAQANLLLTHHNEIVILIKFVLQEFAILGGDLLFHDLSNLAVAPLETLDAFVQCIDQHLTGLIGMNGLISALLVFGVVSRGLPAPAAPSAGTRILVVE